MAFPQNPYEKGLIRTDRGLYVDKGNQVFDVRHPDFGGGAKGTGLVDDAPFITAAIAHAVGGTIYFGPGTYKVDSSVTFTDVSVRMDPGAVITKGTSGALVFSGPFDAGIEQCFSGFVAGDITGLRYARPEWWGAVVNDTTVDSGLATLLALTAVSPQEGGVEMRSGTYSVATEIKITTTMNHVKWWSPGRAKLTWNGATDATISVFHAPVSGTISFAHNLLENLHFDGASRTGFCFIIGASSTQGNGSQNIFNSVFYENGTVVGLLIGTNTEPASDDSACSLNLFNGGFAANSPINVKVNAVDAYENKFDNFAFVSNVSGRVNQHFRGLFSGITRLIDCEFGPLQKFTPGNPHGPAGDTYCIFTESEISVKNAYTEEARFITVPNMGHSNNSFVILDGIYMNDSRTDSDLDNMNLVNHASGTLTARDFGGRVGATGTRPVNFLVNQGTLDNVILGVNGRVTSSIPERTVVDGIRISGFQSVVHPHNWNLQHWIDSSGSDDVPMYWVPAKGTGSTAVILRSTSNNVFGDFTLDMNVTAASSSGLVGVRTILDVGPGRTPFTLVVTGSTDGVDANAPGVTLNGVTKVNSTIVESDNTFVVTAEIDPSGVATGTQNLDIGLNINLTGQYFIDTIVAVPGFYASGLASAFKSAAHIMPEELTSTVVWNPGSLVDGAGETSPNIALAGAKLGDFIVAAAPYDLQGITMTAYMQANDVAKIRLQNETTGTIDLANDTWFVRSLTRLR